MSDKISALQEVWLKYEEGSYGVIYLYEQYEKRLQKAIKTLDEAEFKLLQEFYWRVVSAYKKLHRTDKLKELCTRIIRHIETSERKEELIYIYHQALLAMMYYYVYNRENIKSELLSKRIIDVEKIEDKELYEQLSYESNKSYWMRNHRVASFSALVFLSLELLVFMTGLIKEQLITSALTALAVFLYGKYAAFLNRDQISIDPFEFWTIDNVIRAWVNKTFKLNLGYQHEIATFNGTVLDILDE